MMETLKVSEMDWVPKVSDCVPVAELVSVRDVESETDIEPAVRDTDADTLPVTDLAVMDKDGERVRSVVYEGLTVRGIVGVSVFVAVAVNRRVLDAVGGRVTETEWVGDGWLAVTESDTVGVPREKVLVCDADAEGVAVGE